MGMDAKGWVYIPPFGPCSASMVTPEHSTSMLYWATTYFKADLFVEDMLKPNS